MSQDLTASSTTNLLGETYYSVVPVLYGRYFAKLSLVPVSPELKALTDQNVDLKDKPNGLREAINDHDWFGVLPLRLTLTSSGARLRCDDAACRWANTITAAIDVLGSLLLLWHAERVLHRHVVAVARRVPPPCGQENKDVEV